MSNYAIDPFYLQRRADNPAPAEVWRLPDPANTFSLPLQDAIATQHYSLVACHVMAHFDVPPRTQVQCGYVGGLRPKVYQMTVPGVGTFRVQQELVWFKRGCADV